MANKVSFTFVLVDKFSAQAKLLSSRLTGVRNALGSIGTTAKSAAASVVGAFGVMKRAAIGLTGALAPILGPLAGIAAVFKFFQIGTGFQDAMADLSVVTGVAGKDLAFLREEAFRLSKTMNVSSTEIVEAFKLVGSAKSDLLKTPEALSKVTEGALALSRAAGIDASIATNALVTSLNQFNAPASDAARFAEILASGARIGAAEVFDVGDSIVRAGVAAKRANIGFAETNALLQVLAQNGIKGEMAGTNLRTVLLRLESQGIRRFKPSAVGLNQALENLRTSVGSNATALRTLFGIEGSTAAGILMDNTVLVRKWSEEIASATTLQDQLATRNATLSAKTRGLGITISNFIIRTFDRLAPQLEGAIDKFGKFLDSITASDIEVFAGHLVTIASAIGTIASFTGGAIESVGYAAAFWGGIVGRGESAAGNTPGGLAALGGFSGAGGRSQTEINMQVRSAPGTVESVKTKTTGEASGLKLGVAMREDL